MYSQVDMDWLRLVTQHVYQMGCPDDYKVVRRVMLHVTTRAMLIVTTRDVFDADSVTVFVSLPLRSQLSVQCTVLELEQAWQCSVTGDNGDTVLVVWCSLSTQTKVTPFKQLGQLLTHLMCYVLTTVMYLMEDWCQCLVSAVLPHVTGVKNSTLVTWSVPQDHLLQCVPVTCPTLQCFSVVPSASVTDVWSSNVISVHGVITDVLVCVICEETPVTRSYVPVKSYYQRDVMMTKIMNDYSTASFFIIKNRDVSPVFLDSINDTRRETVVIQFSVSLLIIIIIDVYSGVLSVSHTTNMTHYGPGLCAQFVGQKDYCV